MTVVATQRAILSDLIKGVMAFEEDTKTNFNFESVTVGGSTTIGCIGIPVIWVDGNTQFEVYVAQDIPTAIATGGSPLPDGSVIGLLVGSKEGKGFNRADIDLSTGDETMTILYRGDATIVNEGIVWGGAGAPAQTAFLEQLEKQRITTIANAEVVTPSYTA